LAEEQFASGINHVFPQQSQVVVGHFSGISRRWEKVTDQFAIPSQAAEGCGPVCAKRPGVRQSRALRLQHLERWRLACKHLQQSAA